MATIKWLSNDNYKPVKNILTVHRNLSHISKDISTNISLYFSVESKLIKRVFILPHLARKNNY